jgi:anaerobic dimethyl sulfoxide reductase subunit C
MKREETTVPYSPQFSLTAFTLTLQMVVGALLFVELLQFSWLLSRSELPAPELRSKSYLILSVLAGAGLLLSLLHLGSPQRAILALKNWRTSWLSREIWFTLLFTGVLLLSALLARLTGKMTSISCLTSMVAVIIGMILIYVMAQVYRLRAMPGWRSTATFADFARSALLMGSTLSGAVLSAIVWAVLPDSGAFLQFALRASGLAAILIIGFGFILVPALQQRESRPNRVVSQEQQEVEKTEAAQRLRIRFVLSAGGVLLLNAYLSNRSAPDMVSWVTVLVSGTAYLLVLLSEIKGRLEFFQTPEMREL